MKYFINFANSDEIAIEKSIGYIISSLQKMKYLNEIYLSDDMDVVKVLKSKKINTYIY